MKTSIAITAFALAFAGAAYAQDGGTGPGQTYQGQATTQSGSHHHAKGNGLIAKTKRGMHRMGNKVRHAMHRDHRNDTAAMGAANDGDSARRARLDEAYANYHSKQAR
jgi:hypothetical protein